MQYHTRQRKHQREASIVLYVLYTVCVGVKPVALEQEKVNQSSVAASKMNHSKISGDLAL